MFDSQVMLQQFRRAKYAIMSLCIVSLVIGSRAFGWNAVDKYFGEGNLEDEVITKEQQILYMLIFLTGLYCIYILFMKSQSSLNNRTII